RPQGDPARGLALPLVHLEPDPAGRAPVERPRTVRQAPGTNVIDRRAELLVGRGPGPRGSWQRGGGTEVVQGPQDVVVPAVRVRETQELLVGRLAGAEAAEEPAFQEVLLAGRARGQGTGRAAGGPFVLQEPLEHVDSGVEGRADRAAGPLAVPAAVIETLTGEALDQGRDVDPEVGPVGHGPAVDALLDLALPVGLVALLPARAGADEPDGSPGPVRRRIEPELPPLRQRMHR